MGKLLGDEIEGDDFIGLESGVDGEFIFDVEWYVEERTQEFYDIAEETYFRQTPEAQAIIETFIMSAQTIIGEVNMDSIVADYAQSYYGFTLDPFCPEDAQDYEITGRLWGLPISDALAREVEIDGVVTPKDPAVWFCDFFNRGVHPQYFIDGVKSLWEEFQEEIIEELYGSQKLVDELLDQLAEEDRVSAIFDKFDEMAEKYPEMFEDDEGNDYDYNMLLPIWDALTEARDNEMAARANEGNIAVEEEEESKEEDEATGKYDDDDDDDEGYQFLDTEA